MPRACRQLAATVHMHGVWIIVPLVFGELPFSVQTEGIAMVSLMSKPRYSWPLRSEALSVSSSQDLVYEEAGLEYYWAHACLCLPSHSPIRPWWAFFRLSLHAQRGCLSPSSRAHIEDQSESLIWPQRTELSSWKEAIQVPGSRSWEVGASCFHRSGGTLPKPRWWFLCSADAGCGTASPSCCWA